MLVVRMSAGARSLELEQPCHAPGAVADVYLVYLDVEWEVGESGYESRSANSPYAGRRLTGRVRMTVAGGAVAYRERTFAIEAV